MDVGKIEFMPFEFVVRGLQQVLRTTSRYAVRGESPALMHDWDCNDESLMISIHNFGHFEEFFFLIGGTRENVVSIGVGN